MATIPPSVHATRMSPPPAPIATIKPVVVKIPVPIILDATRAEAGIRVRTRRPDSEVEGEVVVLLVGGREEGTLIARDNAGRNVRTQERLVVMCGGVEQPHCAQDNSLGG